MHIGIIEHLIHVAQLEYDRFHGDYGEALLKYEDCLPKCRRSVLKCKTIGLVRHDRVLLQDARLPEHLILKH